MKLSTKFLTLLAVSSAFAYSIPNKREEQLDLKETEDDYDYSYLGINPIFPIKKECDDAINKLAEEYEDCAQLIEAADLENDKACLLLDDKCKTIFEYKFTEIPECKSSEKASLIGLENILKVAYSDIKLICLTDENGKRCPLSDYRDLDEADLSTWTEDQYIAYEEQLKNKTCKSKKCTEGLVESIEEIRSIRDELESYINQFENAEEIQEEFDENTLENPVVTNNLLREAHKKVKRQEFEVDIDNELTSLVEFFKSKECTSQFGTLSDEKAAADVKKPRKCIVRKN